MWLRWRSADGTLRVNIIIGTPAGHGVLLTSPRGRFLTKFDQDPSTFEPQEPKLWPSLTKFDQVKSTFEPPQMLRLGARSSLNHYRGGPSPLPNVIETFSTIWLRNKYKYFLISHPTFRWELMTPAYWEYLDPQTQGPHFINSPRLLEHLFLTRHFHEACPCQKWAIRIRIKYICII